MTLRDRISAFLHPDSIKINPAYAGMISYSDTPQPVAMPKNYKSFAKEGYRGNDTVFKCISYIARNGAAIPPILYTDDTKKTPIKNHAVLDLLKKPNNEQSGVAYREAAISYKLLSGNSFQYAIRPSKNGPPAELWVLRPDQVQVVPSSTRGIIGYKYEFLEQMIPKENIGHAKYWNPDDELYGLAPTEVGALTIDQQKAAKLWNLSLLQNSARPPGAWTVPTTLSPNDRSRLEAKLKEKLQGYKNAGTPPVLDAGLTWQSMGIEPSNMDWLEGIQYNASNLANIWNIPPQLIGDNSATTYNNVQEAKAASYTEEIFPELDDFYALLTNWLLPMYPDLANSGAVLGYDKETVEVVQAVIQAQKDAIAQRAINAYLNGGCTLNQCLVSQGYEEIGDQGEVYRIGLILVPASELLTFAKKSITTPVAPPVPVAEDSPTDPTMPPDAPSNEPKKPDDAGKKYLDRHDVYQPDDLVEQLAKYQAKGYEYITWVCNKEPCEQCLPNNNHTIKLGSPFPSGHILTPLHPNCDCEIRKAPDPSKSSLREEYRLYKGLLDATITDKITPQNTSI